MEAERMSQRQDSNVTRRSFLKWSLVAGGALAALPLLEACSSRSSQQAAAPPAATTAAQPVAATSAAAPAAGPAAAPPAGPTAGTRTGITSAEWNPTTIKAQAGTLKVDTSADVAKVVPL